MSELERGFNTPEIRRNIRAVERHAERCSQCQQALQSPPGRFLLCPEGDDLVAIVYRDVYERHMAMVRSRQKHYRSRRDPFGAAQEPPSAPRSR